MAFLGLPLAHCGPETLGTVLLAGPALLALSHFSWLSPWPDPSLLRKKKFLLLMLSGPPAAHKPAARVKTLGQL